MLFSIFDARKLSLLILCVCVWISLRNQNAETTNVFDNRISASLLDSPPVSLAPSSSELTSLVKKIKVLRNEASSRLLEYDFYRKSCPRAEQIIRGVVQRLYQDRSNVAQELLRLVFHDCFIEGCDGSVLLDDDYGMDSEKESPQNQNLQGFDLIDMIKSEVEAVCPGVVSCSDILVLAARDGVILAGGPYYPLCTGRRDSSNSFPDLATDELPSPYHDLRQTLAAFLSRGFHKRETFILLGALSFGSNHCKYFLNRLYAFEATNELDSYLDMEFLNHLRSNCYGSHGSHGQSSSLQPTLSSYFSPPRETKWVKAYASALSSFRKDFTFAMMKLSNLQVLTEPMGQIRLNCSQVA